MIEISKLNFGYSDAENYKRRENKDFFNRIFIRDNHLDELVQPNVSFLVGEKGTGKTAYSIFLSNNNYKNNIANIKYIRETDYAKFVSLKKGQQLTLSDFNNIWKVILLLLISHQIREHENDSLIDKLMNYSKFAILNDAIEEYYFGAFSPEINQAINFAEESKVTAELLAKIANVNGEEKTTRTFSENRIQMNLFYIQKMFEDGLRQIKLKQNHIIFIDGIDIRPSNISFNDYLECIKGLGNAIWELNNDFFPTIKGSKGRLKIVMLVRPDIFNSLGLQNQNTKLKDNSVYLDWRTSYANYFHSSLFHIADHLLSNQQINSNKSHGESWAHYFNWNTPSLNQHLKEPSSFIQFLRYSYYRPRDILTMFDLLKANVSNDPNKKQFDKADFENSTFQRNYSNHLLGEVKDQLSFYYASEEYDLFLKFFEYLNGSDKFNYDEYLTAYDNLVNHISSLRVSTPKFMTTANDFLQFLFDLNVIGYIDYTDDNPPKRLFHWCFKDRNYSNISPKVKTGVEYEVFYGLSKALNLGKKIK